MSRSQHHTYSKHPKARKSKCTTFEAVTDSFFITYYFLRSLIILFITFFKHVAIGVLNVNFQAWSIGSFLCIIKLAKRMHLSFFDPVSSRLALLNRLLSTESLLVAMGLPAESLPVYFLEIVAQ